MILSTMSSLKRILTNLYSLSRLLSLFSTLYSYKNLSWWWWYVCLWTTWAVRSTWNQRLRCVCIETWPCHRRYCIADIYPPLPLYKIRNYSFQPHFLSGSSPCILAGGGEGSWRWSPDSRNQYKNYSTASILVRVGEIFESSPLN